MRRVDRQTILEGLSRGSVRYQLVEDALDAVAFYGSHQPPCPRWTSAESVEPCDCGFEGFLHLAANLRIDGKPSEAVLKIIRDERPSVEEEGK